MRSANRSTSLASHDPASCSPSSACTSCGTWVYAQSDSVPVGERLGSVVVIWPTSKKGSDGITCAWILSWLDVSSSSESAMWTVPGAASGALAHGTGPESAQSTLTVAGSCSNRCIRRCTRGGSSLQGTKPPYNAGAATSATTATASYRS